MKRSHVTVAVALLALMAAAPALAQDAEAPPAAEAPAEEAAEAEAPPAEPPPAETPPAEPQAQVAPRPAPPADRRYARPRTPPPILVAVLPGERVAAEAVTAAREALVAQIGPMAGGRAVHGVGADQMVSALSACDGDTCVGSILAEAGAQAGVLLRLTRRGRQLAAALEIRDPVSGALRVEAPIEGELPTEPADLAEPLAGLSARIASAVPSAPAQPPSLLISTTVDGATVTVDGEDIGESPVAPIAIADGTHEVIVRLAGYRAYRTETRISPGQRARVDATLESMDGEAMGDGDNPFTSGDGGGDDDLLSQWWFWTAIGGGAAVLIAGIVIIAVVASDSGDGMPMPQQPMGIPLPAIQGGP